MNRKKEIIMFFSLFMIAIIAFTYGMYNIMNIDEAIREQIVKRIESIDKPMTEELKKCIVRSTMRTISYTEDPNVDFIISNSINNYDDCRWQKSKINITYNKINHSCNQIREFLELDIYPKIKRVCHGFKILDVITNNYSYEYNVCPEFYSVPNNCGEGCTNSPQSNYLTKEEFGDYYIKECINEEEE